MEKFLEKLGTTKNYLILANIFLGLFLVVLSNLNLIPLQLGDSVFLIILAFAFALYRPGWAFLIFVGVIGFETINLASETLPFALRPYQIMGTLVILALVIRKISRRMNMELIKMRWFDLTVGVFVLASFLSAFFSADRNSSLKLSLILVTFAAFYLLARNYLQSKEDIRKIIPFLLGSAGVIVIYGIWQNWRFLHGSASFEVMLGRPNSVFPEADWLGIYLVLIVSFTYSIIFYLKQETSENGEEKFKVQSSKLKITVLSQRLIRLWRKNSKLFLSYLFLILVFVALILTVSRSAWLGAFFATIIFFWAVFTDFKFGTWELKKTVWVKLEVFVAILIALGIAYSVPLTNFDLLGRAQSTGTGLQKITISCIEDPSKIGFPEMINDISVLAQVGCKHINLEDIEKEKLIGHFIGEINRRDPNVATRSEIYRKSFGEIKKHPILGIGWGSIGRVFGLDERGAALNSSNIFLETWLGAGIIGVLAFLALWFFVVMRNIWNFTNARDNLSRSISLFFILSWFALTVSNLFNAGLFLGFLWLWLGAAFTEEKKGKA